MSIHYGGRGPGHIARVQGGGPALNLDLTTALDSRITFSRGSSATYFDSAGILQTASSNVARIDYDPVTLVSRGLLIEETRTNLCLYSDDLTNAAWTKTNCTAAKTATGPDGLSNSASTITATAGNATVLQAITNGSAARITSCLIKRRTGTGTIEMTQDNGATWAAVTVTSGWTRVSIASATLANPTIGLRLVTNADAVDVWGFQNERGNFVTSVIPTTASTATRSADVATMTGTNFSSWYNQAQGTFVVGADSYVAVSTSVYYAASAGDGSGINFLSAYAYNGRWGASSKTGGVFQFDLNQEASYTANTAAKVAFAYKAYDFAVSVNGNTALTDTSGTVPTVDRLVIGALTTAGQLNGHIARITYYPSRLSDAQLVTLST